MLALWRILVALPSLPALVKLHWAPLAVRAHKTTWACAFKGQPVRLPVLAICPVTGRWLVEYPDGRLDFVNSQPARTLKVGEEPAPPGGDTTPA